MVAALVATALEALKLAALLFNVYCVFLIVSKARQCSRGGAGSKDRRRVLFVIAHPDDEAMFFVPTITALQGRHELSLLCLSNGNADGLGKIREKELLRSCAILGFNASSVVILNDERLQDGMQSVWDPAVVAEYVRDHVRRSSITRIITFDSYGVSGHVNHIATYEGVRRMLKEEEQTRDEKRKDGDEPVMGLKLDSTVFLRKYAGPLDALISAFSLHVFFSWQPSLNYRAMQAHHSQFVWYRRLFVIFSRYTFVNTLSRIDVTPPRRRGGKVHAD